MKGEGTDFYHAKTRISMGEKHIAMGLAQGMKSNQIGLDFLQFELKPNPIWLDQRDK